MSCFRSVRRLLDRSRYETTRKRIHFLHHAVPITVLIGAAGYADAARLADVGVLDKDYLVVHISDGDVVHHEGSAGEEVIRYTPELNTSAASQTGNWTITSSQDPNYGGSGQHPQSIGRKTKLSGHSEGPWSGNDYTYEYTYEHWIHLNLPSSLQQGVTYTLQIASAVNSDTASASVTFDIYHSVSEAIHVNLVGYAPDAPHKAADLYYWMGSGGARSYSSFEGNAVYVYNVANGQSTQAGAVAFWRSSGSDVGGYNLTRSDVWNVDFSNFATPGTYRLVVDGVGCSQDFVIADDVYADPFKVGVRGYFYMRIGEDNPGMVPPPRTPLYIPGVTPANTTVYLTTMHPYHPDWNGLTGGDNWDRSDAWIPYRKAGNPTNPNAWGGHSDAADWDRHLGHVTNIYDMLLTYILTNGAIGDDDTGITESGNGIPDIIDEARYEVDFWLRLRDGDGYSHGVTCPNYSTNVFHQAGPTAIAAWANALNAAMLADAFRISGHASLMNEYRDAAIEAYNHANGLADPQLDDGLDQDDGTIRGRDFKMMAAAFLYNVTGDQSWENAVNAESVCSASPATILNNSRNQIWGTAAYLVTPRTVHYPAMQSNMRTQIINEAKSVETNRISSRPSRRATDQTPSYWRTAHFVDRTIIAHAVADDPADEALFRKALALEADWGLGRNPMNHIQMTTATTPLESKRSVVEAYTSGRDDGVPGVHPGHTPYMNLDDWDSSMVMGSPSRLYANSYPSSVLSTWPRSETSYPSRFVWAHTEFTPRQTMRGKMALYGYLYGLASAEPPQNPILGVTIQGISGASGTVTSSPSGINCGADCDETYPNGTVVTLTAAPAGGSVFVGWSGSCYGSDSSCSVTMDLNRSVTATFEPVGMTYALSVSRTGTGSGTVTSSPSGINCGSDCGEDFPSGSDVTLTAIPDSDSTFVGWNGACSGSGTCTVSMTTNRSVTAEFRSNIVEPVIIYDDALASGWVDYSWTATINLAGTSPVHSGTHAVNATLGAWGAFSPYKSNGAIDTYGYDAIEFWVHGGTGSSKSIRFYTENGGSSSDIYNFVAPAGAWTETTVTLSDLGNPESIDRLNFMNFSSSGIEMFTLDEIRLVPGNTSTYPLSVSKAGNGAGTVTSNPGGINCGGDCDETYASGTVVTLTADPGANSTFAGWSGACSGTDTCTVIMNDVRSVTATFDVTSSFTLNVNTAGTGFGSIVSDPSGITCGDDCSEMYLPGTTVTLTPLPAAGTTFTGWSGACSGTDTCTVTMSGSCVVTATFSGGGTIPGSYRYVGRVDTSTPGQARFAWQGAGVVAAVTGPMVSVNLRTVGTGTVYFQPVIDGIPGDRFEVMQGGVQTVTLAAGLSAGEHIVELYRETEGMYGESVFSGFAQGTVVGAPAASGRLIEVVGDSISAGYGNLGYEEHPPWTSSCGYSAETSSWFKTYASLAGRTFGAEVSTIARSGWGMYRDRNGDTNGVLPLVYENAVGTDDPTPWSFTPKADLVIINLGTNDINPGDPGVPYETAYASFIQNVRSRYPNAWIFATIGSMLAGSELAAINTHLANVVAAVGDPKVITFDMGTQDTSTTGCDWHPDVEDHERMAEILKEQIRTRLGWPRPVAPEGLRISR
jgi:endoglucanase